MECADIQLRQNLKAIPRNLGFEISETSVSLVVFGKQVSIRTPAELPLTSLVGLPKRLVRVTVCGLVAIAHRPAIVSLSRPAQRHDRDQ